MGVCIVDCNADRSKVSKSGLLCLQCMQTNSIIVKLFKNQNVHVK